MQDTFRTSSQPEPVHLFTKRGGGFTLSFFIIERQIGKLSISNFLVFGLTQPGIEPEPAASFANVPSTRPLIIGDTSKVIGKSNVFIFILSSFSAETSITKTARFGFNSVSGQK